MPTQKLLILSGDPGTANHGYAVVEAVVVSENDSKYVESLSILQYGLNHHTLREMSGRLDRSLVDYSSSYIQLLKEFRQKFPEHTVLFAAERYMTRGFGGTTIESVSAMLGSVVTVLYLRGVESEVYPAAVWKNASAAAGISLEELYAFVKENYNVPDHAVDAAMIGIYRAYRHAGVVPYSQCDQELFETLLSSASPLDLGERPKKVPKKVPKKPRKKFRRK